MKTGSTPSTPTAPVNFGPHDALVRPDHHSVL
jgi:hypothetical protein